MLFVKPGVWVGLATQTSLLTTTITMLAAPLGALIGAGISQGAGKLVNVAMPFAVTWLLANLQPSHLLRDRRHCACRCDRRYRGRARDACEALGLDAVTALQ